MKTCAILSTIFLLSACPFFLQAQLTTPSSLRQQYLFQEHLAGSIVFDIIQDQQGFMWFATAEALIRYDGFKLKSYRNIPGDSTSLKGNVITKLALTQQEQLWVGTMRSGLHLLDLKTEKFQRFHATPNCINCISHNKIQAILATNNRNYIATADGRLNFISRDNQWFKTEDSTLVVNDILKSQSGEIWLGTNKGLVHFSEQQEVHLLPQIKKEDGQPVQIKSLAEDRAGNIWCGTIASGLFRYYPNDKKVERIPLEHIGLIDAGWQHVWDILPEANGQVWIASDAGLALLSSTLNTWKAAIYDEEHVTRAISIYKSRDGVIWLGTNDGIQVLVPKLKKFRIDSLPVPIRGVYIHPKLHQNNLWVGTFQGLYQYDLSKHSFHQDFLLEHPALEIFNRWFVANLLLDSQGRLWISEVINFNERFAVYYYDFNSKKLTEVSNQFLPLQTGSTRKIIEDHAGNIWLANGAGVIAYNTQQETFELYDFPLPKGSPKDAQNLFLEPNGDLWIGWTGAGLSRYNLQTKAFNHFMPNSYRSDALVHESVWYIAPYDEQHLFIGTNGGLSIFNKKTEKCLNYTVSNGLFEPKVYQHCTDKNGQTWFATHNHLYRLDSTGIAQSYDVEDGMDFRVFTGQNTFQNHMGILYFGGDEGLLRFHPDSLHAHTFSPKVVFTQFRLFNKTVEINDTFQLLYSPIHRTQQIKLRHKQNLISFDYSALSYLHPKGHQYAYFLENFDTDWQYVGQQKSVTFTNLDIGKYQLHVKAANADGVWSKSPTTLELVVLPPWYLTWWAYLLWIALLGSIIHTIYRFQLNRRLALAEAHRLQELDAIKTKLYTNITHEFRTPISIILGLAEEFKKQLSSTARQQLDVIKHNGKTLLKLVNQILALSKLEAGAEQLNLQQSDVIPFLKYIIESFQSFAYARQIDLKLHCEVDQLEMDFDAEKLQIILSNLISNALKFTAENGQVQVYIAQRDKQLQIEVADNGVGIASEKISRIFDRYYQVDISDGTSSGIGLTLVKEYIQMLGGTIEVKSKPNRGTTFYLQLPITQQAKKQPAPIVEKENATVIRPLPTAVATSDSNRPLLLLIEDNRDVLHYLSSILSNDYQLLLASDGAVGSQKALTEIPDLIISDVMMPKKNGYEVCTQLKKDERTSHIPVILLTAKADFDSKIEGLELGADVYLTKPFEKQELQVQVQRLLAQRSALQTHYSQLAMLPTNRYQVHQGEETFLYRLQSLLEENLSNENFGINEICEHLHLSRMHLHRKLKALTNQSASQYILTLRLQRAKDLLKTTDWSISEITYEVGFKSASYFSQVFLREVGMTPSEWRRE